jgi:hypothetical protein
MNDMTILCATIAFFVAWVVYLKLKMAELTKQNEELSNKIKSQQQALHKAVEVSEGKKSWGRKPGWTS